MRAVQGAAADVYDLPPQVPRLAARLGSNQALDQLTARVLTDVREKSERINIALRLYAGYLDAAKVIAGSTRHETNDATTRRRDIPKVD